MTVSTIALTPLISLIAGVLILVMPRLLNYIVPDFVHVMSNGRVVKSGGKELALELEESGYAQFEEKAA